MIKTYFLRRLERREHVGEGTRLRSQHPGAHDEVEGPHSDGNHLRVLIARSVAENMVGKFRFDTYS